MLIAPVADNLMVAAIVAVTDLPGSRQEMLMVTNCPTVELPLENPVPPAHVAPCVVAAVEGVTVPTVRFESRVSVNATSKAVVALLPVALLVKVNVYVIVSPG